MYNPFYRMVKAEDIPAEEIRHVFVPEASSVWGEVREPVNQIIFGPRGAGKTILLKQLHYVNSLLQQDIPDPNPYLGIYIQISRLSNIFRHLFQSNTLVAEQKDESERRYQDAFADYLCLEIFSELTKGFERYFTKNGKALGEEEIRAIIGKVENVRSVAEFLQFCERTQQSIEQKFGDWQLKRYCDWVPRFEIGTSVDRMARAIESISLKKLSKPLFVYLLLDESCPVPERCQEVANVLLQRGRSFKTKLAVRPYEWVTLKTKLGVEIEEGNDFRKLQIEYPDELTDEYINQMSVIVNRILKTQVVDKRPPPEGWPKIEKISVGDIFGKEVQKDNGKYWGFKDICALSSGSPQNLLSICSTIFSSTKEYGKITDGKFPFVPADLQHQAMAAWSKDKFHEISHLSIREFCRALLNQIVKKGSGQTAISFHAKQHEPILFEFEEEVLPEGVGESLKPGFGSGILKFPVGTRVGFWEVSAKFKVTRTLLPRFNIPLHIPTLPPLPINYRFIQRFCREQFGAGQPKEKEKNGERELSAFLSTSFSACSSEERCSIKKVLKDVNVDCKDVEDKPRGQILYSDILRLIKANDFTIFNATILSPYTLFEIGLCAGLRKPKPVICIFNDEGDSENENFSNLPDYLRKVPIIRYSISPERLKGMAVEIRRSAKYLIDESSSEFMKVASTGISLRPQRRDKKNIYISFPNHDIWSTALPAIREELETKMRYQIVTEDEAGILDAHELQIPIRCAYITGFAIIDTSDSKEPDLLQSYKLGVVCAAAKCPVLRIEQVGKAHKGDLNATPAKYSDWKNVDELVKLIRNFVEEQNSGKATKKKHRK